MWVRDAGRRRVFIGAVAGFYPSAASKTSAMMTGRRTPPSMMSRDFEAARMLECVTLERWAKLQGAMLTPTRKKCAFLPLTKGGDGTLTI